MSLKDANGGFGRYLYIYEILKVETTGRKLLKIRILTANTDLTINKTRNKINYKQNF